MVFTGNANPGPGAGDRHAPGHRRSARPRSAASPTAKSTVEIKQNVRARDVFVVQSTCAPTNENLMELLHHGRRAQARLGRAHHRGDPVFRLRPPGPPPALDARADLAKVVANLLETVGVERVLTMDLHADQIQGFFDIPVDNIYASPVLLSRPASARTTTTWSSSRPTSAAWCAPGRWPSSSDCDLAIIDKRRPKANVSEVMHVIGEIDGPQLRDHGRHDRHRRHAGEGGRGAEGARREEGLRLLHAPDLLGPGDRAHRSVALDEVVVTNTIPLTRRRARLQEDPPAVGGVPVRRDDPAHLRGRVGDVVCSRSRTTTSRGPRAAPRAGLLGRGLQALFQSKRLVAGASLLE